MVGLGSARKVLDGAERLLYRAQAGEVVRKERTLAKSFASPPLEAILSKAQSGMTVCVYPSTPSNGPTGIES
jgi:hypothetical protein